MNLKLYFSQEQYETLAGPDWPLYDDFVQGAKATKPEVQQEIDDWVKKFKLEGINFPIKTATACQYKWTWSSLFLNNLSSASCHRAGLVKFDLDEFDNFHNLPKKIQDRKFMLQGQWPATGGCSYCQLTEANGGFSDRQSALTMRGFSPPELETDPTATVVTPRILDVFVANTCNLACVYCNSALSSRIEMENIKHGRFEKDGIVLPVNKIQKDIAGEYFDKFIVWLGKNIGSLKKLNLLGGETYLQHKALNSVLSVIEQNPAPDLTLCIFSNFNVPQSVWNEYNNRIRDLQQAGAIRKFELTASIDCWGPEAEYIRNGLDLVEFEEKFAWAVSQSVDWIDVSIHQTITSLGMRTMPALMRKIAEYSRYRYIRHDFQFVGDAADENQRHHMHPKQFAYQTWADDFEQTLAAMPKHTEQQQDAVRRMIGMQKTLEPFTTHNYEKIHQLHVYLDELDRRRSTNWRELFPYLDIKQ